MKHLRVMKDSLQLRKWELLNMTKRGNFCATVLYQGSSIIECQLNTGATCNVMSMAYLCIVLYTQNPPLKPEASQLRCYDNSVIKTLKASVYYSAAIFNAKTYQSPFEVIDGKHKPLLSDTTCVELSLRTMHTVCNITSTACPTVSFCGNERTFETQIS